MCPLESLRCMASSTPYRLLAGAPAWFRAGEPLASVRTRTPDPDGILALGFPGVEDGDWRECLVPVIQLPFVAVSNLENVRVQRIREWIRQRGGITTALAEAPVVVTIRGEQIELEDGYHRLCLAVVEHGATHVRAVCALIPSDSEPLPGPSTPPEAIRKLQ